MFMQLGIMVASSLMYVFILSRRRFSISLWFCRVCFLCSSLKNNNNM
jgi:hypothetical protein